MYRTYSNLRHSLYWDETECLNYYGMLSLHEIFEIVGTQLTETDIEVMSFLLDETFPGRHPLDPAGWMAEIGQEDPANAGGEPPGPALLNAWRRIEPRGSICPIAARHRPKSGTELLLELEKRGYLSEESLEPLLQLLRVLTRHDLLHLVSRKKRRTDFSPPTPEPARKKRKKRGHAWCIKGQKTAAPPPEKVSCDVRLRVRAEYLQQESALRNGVISDKQQPLERQFELFSRASSLLRELEVGSVVCDIKFTELDNLEAFWSDYLRGALLEALKGVFITDWMRSEAGPDGVRLLISVDQDDYEEGRLVLMAGRCRNGSKMPNTC